MSTQESEFSTTSNGRNPVIVIGGGVVILIALLALVFGATLLGNNTAEEAAAPETAVQLPTSGPPVTVGAQPYQFTVRDLEGNSVQLSEFIGQPVILNFWATWCGPCRIEMPHLQSTFEQHQDDGLVILALDQDESPEEVEDFFFDEFGLTFTPLLDDESQVAENYGLLGTLPTSVFINPDGEITAIHRGPMVPEQIDGYLADTLPN